MPQLRVLPLQASAEFNDNDDTAHGGSRANKGWLGAKGNTGNLKDAFSVHDVDVVDPKAIMDETPEQRWERLDSDAHMSVYLEHEGAHVSECVCGSTCTQRERQRGRERERKSERASKRRVETGTRQSL